MKVHPKIIFILILGVMCISASAQECRKTISNSETEVQTFESVDIKQYEGWKKTNIPNYISFYIPSDFEKADINGNGNHSPSEFMKFKSKDFILFGDFTTNAYSPPYRVTLFPSFCRWYSSIDGASAYFWHFEPNAKKNEYESGIYFQFNEDKNYRIGITLKSETKDTKEIAEKIFKSITFLRKPVPPTIPH